MADLTKYVRDVFKRTKLRPRTQRHYTYTVVGYLEFLRDEYGIDDALDAEPEHVDAWMDYLRDEGGKSADSIGVYVAAVHRFYLVVCAKARKPKANPVLRVDRPRQRVKKLPNVCRGEDIDRVLESLDLDDFVESRLAAFIALAAGTGARRDEILGVELSDLDRRLSEVTYLNTKSGQARTVQIPSNARPYLKRWLSTRARRERTAYNGSERVSTPTSGYLFVSWRNGGRVDSTVINKQFVKFFERCDIVGVTPHTLRHTNATNQVVRGTADIGTIKENLGHTKKSNTIYRYTHLDVESLRKMQRRCSPMK